MSDKWIVVKATGGVTFVEKGNKRFALRFDDGEAELLARYLNKMEKKFASPSAPAEQAAPKDYETHRAIMEGARNAACEEYFKARPQIDFIGNRRVFEAGFQRGYEAPASQAAPVTVPEGWRLVPLELTQEMRAAWDRSPSSEDDDVDMRNAFRAMLAAAPAAPSADAQDAKRLDWLMHHILLGETDCDPAEITPEIIQQFKGKIDAAMSAQQKEGE